MSDNEDIIRLTLGVARLGEADLLGWWRSRGLTEAGQYVLGESLSRTWTLSALEADVLCATIRHEEALGRPTALHLFSDALPARSHALAWLRKRKAAGDGDGVVGRLRAWTIERARRDILLWANTALPPTELLGRARRLRSLSRRDLDDPARIATVLRQLGAAYADQTTDIRFPYFDLSP